MNLAKLKRQVSLLRIKKVEKRARRYWIPISAALALFGLYGAWPGEITSAYLKQVGSFALAGGFAAILAFKWIEERVEENEGFYAETWIYYVVLLFYFMAVVWGAKRTYEIVILGTG